MKKQFLTTLFACFMLLTHQSAAVGADSLQAFLHSKSISERRTAYLDILKNQERYVYKINLGLETFARTKEKRIDVLNRYIYLAAIIRSDKFIDPLVTIFKDYYDLGGSCANCCPIVFALTLYGAFSNWSPPEMMSHSSSGMAWDVRNGILNILEMKKRPLVWVHMIADFADPERQKLFERMESLSVEELIKMASSDNEDGNERYDASYILAGKVVDDKNITELYWLAIEELTHDPSGIYRCSIYEAIKRAEIAKEIRKRQNGGRPILGGPESNEGF